MSTSNEKDLLDYRSYYVIRFFCNARVVANKIKYIFFNLLFVPHELPYLQKIKYVKDTFLVFIKFLPKDIFIIGYFFLESVIMIKH